MIPYRDTIFLILLFAIMCLTAASLVRIDEVNKRMAFEEAEAEEADRIALEEYDRQKARIADYLRKRGGVYPDIVARACMQTSNPPLCAAVALKESTANPYTLPGDAGQAHGGWQIWPKWWGKVSTDPFAQARQYDNVLKALLMRNNGELISALQDYNGGGRGYAFAVLTHAEAMR